MDFHCYVAYVEVVSRSSGQLGQCFVFDEHYIKSKTYWQRLAQHIAVPRVIGATCPRLDVDEGEENARYKLALFGLTRCRGRVQTRWLYLVPPWHQAQVGWCGFAQLGRHAEHNWKPKHGRLTPRSGS